MRKALLFSLAGSALMALLILAAGSTERTAAQSAAGPINTINVDVEDDATPANTDTSLGSVQTCVRIDNNNVVDQDEEAGIADFVFVDVTAGDGNTAGNQGVPAFNDNGTPGNPSDDFGALFGFGLSYNFSPTIVALNDPPGADPRVNQLRMTNFNAGSSPFVTNAGAPAGGVSSPSQIETGLPLSDTAESGEGVIATFSMEGIGAGISPITLSNVGILDVANNVYTITNIGSGSIAVDQACPVATDVAVSAVTTTSPANGTAGSAFAVTGDVSISNLGGLDPVNVDTTITLNLPSGCTTPSTNPVTIQDTSVSVAASPLALAQQSWNVTCTNVSNHDFTTTATAAEDSAGAIESNSANNSLTSAADTTAVSGESDLKVQAVVLVGPVSATVGVAFNVTANVDVHNNGPFGPTTADTQGTLTLPGDCTTSSANPQTIQNTSIATSTNTNVPITWSVTCSQSSNHDFSASASIAVDQVHVTDSTPGNNSGQTAIALTVPVNTSADLKVSTVTVTAPASSPINTDFDVTVDATVHNNGPSSATVAVTITLSVPADCTGGGQTNTGPALPVSTPVNITQQLFTVNCTDPSDHAFTADVTIEVVGPLHVSDPNTANDSGSGQDTTAVSADADVKVQDVTLTAPATATAGVAFNVTVDATLHNNGPFGAVNADATATLALPSDCTADPAGAQVAQDVSLAVSTVTDMPQQSWSVTCTDTGAHDVSADVTLAVDQAHVTDTDSGNDSAPSSVLTVSVAAAAAATPTPTPTGTPSGLPPTGGTPGEANGGWMATYVAAAAILALMGAAAFYGVQRRRSTE